MRKILTITCLIALLVGGAAAETIERELDVRSGGLIKFDLDSGATIKITGWNREAVAVSAQIRGEDADIVTLTIKETRKGVLVESDYSEMRRTINTDIILSVKVPNVFDVDIDSMGGSVSIEGVEGDFSGKTMGGSLTLTDLKGNLELTTMGGHVTLTQSDVDGKVTTMGGKALVEDVFGDVKVTSMGGNVVHRRVTRPDGDSIGDQVDITTMGGSIDVPEAPSGANVHTMGGDITIDSAREYVKAKTMGGDIRIDEVDGWVKATTMAGDVDVTLRGGHDVEITSMQGEINLIVPSGVGFDIDIELEYTKNSRRSYQIISDFPISQHESQDWDYDRGTPRKTITGTGTVNGGGHKIVIHTINGNVHLKQGR
ncbi:MAG: DUF4097 domain-containing protein [bacterium]|nr:DUF4097 domain-containing protein [bacterium]